MGGPAVGFADVEAAPDGDGELDVLGAAQAALAKNAAMSTATMRIMLSPLDLPTSLVPVSDASLFTIRVLDAVTLSETAFR